MAITPQQPQLSFVWLAGEKESGQPRPSRTNAAFVMICCPLSKRPISSFLESLMRRALHRAGFFFSMWGDSTTEGWINVAHDVHYCSNIFGLLATIAFESVNIRLYCNHLFGKWGNFSSMLQVRMGQCIVFVWWSLRLVTAAKTPEWPQLVLSSCLVSHYIKSTPTTDPGDTTRGRDTCGMKPNNAADTQ
ncbi:hypothetical protein L228DRAFT_178752 [Xylona heveae TC161]|uniref:Uncharacterized protein n=1 Tax=Xylona heveae (strain CBS 132557 / TC161) TaxID=1328760 RepID=A0A165FA83_XYLHT|nr:hypothetical protein L228DRAFT_178752 [Xylona heveae TC161]KZF20758.1 hypothetical protein L228DRAFT_178752 [Xylona heveae TC161]